MFVSFSPLHLGGLLALPANIILWLIDLTVTNTLAYNCTVLITTAKKFYCTDKKASIVKLLSHKY